MKRYHRHPATRRPAFSLVEILTVVGIIGLLLAILLPSLANMRKNARDTAIRGMLSSVGKGLDTLSADLGEYPNSAFRNDTINWEGKLPATIADQELSGAHWLARSMVGHDFQGVDAQGGTLGEEGGAKTAYSVLANMARKPLYIDANTFANDDDKKTFPGPAIETGNEPVNGFKYYVTQRLVMYDPYYKSPVLYYKANTRAEEPFCLTGTMPNRPGSLNGDRLGIYRQSDNARIAGTDRSGANNATRGWDFTGDGQSYDAAGEDYHRLRQFGSIYLNASMDVNGKSAAPGTFSWFLHDASAPKPPQGMIKPQNAESYILLTAGSDGRFGTADDIGNFKPNP